MAVDAEPDVAAEEADVDAAIDAEIEKEQPVSTDPAKPVEEAKPAETKTEAATDDEFDDVNDNLSIAALNKHIAASPELKSALDKNPALRKQLFYSTRRAARADEYDSMFQTPALAKETKTAADERFEMRQLFESEAPEDATKFWQRLLFDSLVKDDQGRLQIENGRPVSTGHYERATAAYRASVYESMASIAENMLAKGHMVGDITGDDVKEAVRIFQSVIDGKAPTAAQPGANGVPAAENVPSHVQAELDKLRRENAEFKQTTSTTAEQFRESATNASRNAIMDDAKNLLAKRLPANAAVSDYMKNAIVNDVVAAVEKLANENAAHKDLFSRMLRQTPRTDEGLKKIIDFKRGFSKEILPRILSRLITQATSGVVKENRALNQKVTNQQNKAEVRTSGGVTPPTRPDAKTIVRTAEAAASKSGKRVSDMDIVDAVVDAQRKR